VDASGNYFVTYTDINGCVCVSNTISVTVHPNPEIPVFTASGQLTFCEGDDVALTSSVPSNIEWSNGSIGASITSDQAGIYTVTHTDQNGCQSVSESGTVIVNSLPSVSMDLPALVCEETAPITLNGQPSGGIYSGSGVTSGTFNPSLSGQGDFAITYQYTDPNGCTDVVTEMISVESCLSVEQVNQHSFAIFPNPANQTITIQRFQSEIEMELIVYDSNGKIVLKKIIQENPVDIDVSKWAHGNYNFQIRSGELSKTTTVVIQH
jgi:hypothetical protein